MNLHDSSPAPTCSSTRPTSSAFRCCCGTYGGAEPPRLSNYFLATCRGNPMLERAHRLLLALWEGRQSTEGMHANPLLKGWPLQGRSFGEAVSRELTNYIIQGQAMSLVLGLVEDGDGNGGWDGPEYAAEHIYAINYMEGS